MVIDSAGVTNSSEWLKPGGDLPHLRVPLLVGPVSGSLLLLCYLPLFPDVHIVHLPVPKSLFHREYTVPIQAHLVNNGFLLLLERASGNEFNSIKSLYQSPKSSRNEDLSLGSWHQEPQIKQSYGCTAPVCCQEAYRPQ